MEDLSNYYMFAEKLHWNSKGLERKEIKKYMNEGIDQEETAKKTIEIETETLRLIPQAKIFTINEQISTLLKNTNNKIYKRKLPFDVIFINNSFFIENFKILGILLFKSTNNLTFAAVRINVFEKINDFSKEKLRKRYREQNFKEPYIDRIMPFGKFDGDYSKNPNLISADGHPGFFTNKKIGKMINLYICNFLDFLNNPDIETIIVERTQEQNLKRIKRGKLPIPAIHNIKITGKLKIYLDKLNSNKDFNYSHRFDVRGHMRKLRSDKWKNKQGTVIWIPPYIKGDGIYIKKNYEVKQDE